jgi:hypothetical protein
MAGSHDPTRWDGRAKREGVSTLEAWVDHDGERSSVVPGELELLGLGGRVQGRHTLAARRGLQVVDHRLDAHDPGETEGRRGGDHAGRAPRTAGRVRSRSAGLCRHAEILHSGCSLPVLRLFSGPVNHLKGGLGSSPISSFCRSRSPGSSADRASDLADQLP